MIYNTHTWWLLFVAASEAANLAMAASYKTQNILNHCSHNNKLWHWQMSQRTKKNLQ